MQKSGRFNKLLKILLGLSLFLTLFFQVIKPSGPYQKVDSSLYSFTAYLKYIFFKSPVENFKEAIESFVQLKDVQQENSTIRKQLLAQYQTQTRLIEAIKENHELKNLLQLQQTMSELNHINANVIDKDSENFNNTLLINKGSHDGIKLNMPVITAEGLIGQITSLESNSSVVTLLTSTHGSNQFALKVQINENESVEAILDSYNPDTQQYEVRLLDLTKKVSPKMKVVTSGMGEIIPSGLLVGEIESIEESSATLSVVLHVNPAGSFSNINVVMVVSKP